MLQNFNPHHVTQVSNKYGSDIDVGDHTNLPLSSNNPYHRNSRSSRPISPLTQVTEDQIRPSQAYRPSYPSRPSGPTHSQRSNYSFFQEPDPTRRIRVTPAMHDEQNPPAHHGQSPQTVLPSTSVMVAKRTKRHCRTCGETKTTTMNKEDDVDSDCTRCGKLNADSSLTPTDTTSSLHMRSVSDSIVPTTMANQWETSTSNHPVPRRPCCDKCGRKQRPGQVSISSRNFTAPVNPISSQANHQPTSFGAVPARSTHKTLPKMRLSGGQVGIDITPPTASTYHPVNTSGVDDWPSIHGEDIPNKTLSSSSSIVSAISRTFSRHRSRRISPSAEDPLPTQQINKEEQYSPNKLRDKISHAVRVGNNQQTSRLSTAGLLVDRPGSPFSFTDKPAEDDAFEMNDMRLSKIIVDTDDYFSQDPSSTPTPREKEDSDESVQRPKQLRSKSENRTSTLAVKDDDDIFLADSDSRPSITRLKSMRVGVERVAAVTRTTSIKRFNSLKRTPSLWYRNDMVLEGAIGAF